VGRSLLVSGEQRGHHRREVQSCWIWDFQHLSRSARSNRPDHLRHDPGNFRHHRLQPHPLLLHGCGRALDRHQLQSSPAPANSVLVDPNNANIVYVALDTGVYVTQNVASCASFTGACWNVDGSGLPNAPVVSLMSFNQGATQTLRAATWGRGIWQVNLATAGTAPTAATISAHIATFPGQPLQTVSAVQTLILTDAGSLNLNITSLTITGDFVETDNCSGQSLAPQGTCQISVTFDPSQSGARTGFLTVSATWNGGQITVSLAGTGLAPASMVLTPASLTFTGTAVGSQSSPQYVTIANTGGEPSTLANETVTGGFYGVSQHLRQNAGAELQLHHRDRLCPDHLWHNNWNAHGYRFGGHANRPALRHGPGSRHRRACAVLTDFHRAAGGNGQRLAAGHAHQ